MKWFKVVSIAILFHSYSYGEVIISEEESYAREKVQEMRYIIQNTAYCALIIDQNVTIKSLPYNPKKYSVGLIGLILYAII